MDTDLRAALIAAGAAAALSALVGIVSRVDFLDLLLRALLFAVLFGGLAYLAARFLGPMLSSPDDRLGATADEGLGQRSSGRNVDIVLPGEDPEAMDGLEGAVELDADDGSVADATEVGSAEDEGRPAPTRRSETESGPAVTQNMPAAVDRRIQSARPSVAAILPDEVEGAEADSLLEGYPEAGASDRPAVPPTNGVRSPGKDLFDELDVLPDLEGFSDSFAAPEYNAQGSQGQSAIGQPPSRAVEGGADPAALAQAVRTILKRDQKG